jgi:hypothetical protein
VLLGIFTGDIVLFAQAGIKRELFMKWAYVWILAAAMASSVFAAMPSASDSANAEGSSPIFGVTIPVGYRQWELIAPAHETDPFNELRAILGSTLSMTAYRKGTLPFPDGAILAKLAWKRVPSNEFKAGLRPRRGYDSSNHGQRLVVGFAVDKFAEPPAARGSVLFRGAAQSVLRLP